MYLECDLGAFAIGAFLRFVLLCVFVCVSLRAEGRPTARDLRGEAMQIFVKTLTGKTFDLNGARALDVKYIALEAEASDTVLTIKAKIQEQEDITPNPQRLIYRGQRMENDLTLSDCDVQEGAELQMEVNWGMQIVVKTWDDKNITMDVLPIDRTMLVKAMLQDQDGVPTDQQILISASGIMQYDFTMSDYNIRNGETLLQMRMTEPLVRRLSMRLSGRP